MTLPRPRTASGRAGLDALLTDPAGAVVGLDFDGTLSPIVDDPERARAHPGAVPALRRLLPSVRSVAVVTGRPAAVAAEYAGLVGTTGLDGLVVLGAYGAERWDGATGEVAEPDPSPGVERARQRLPGLLADLGAPEGVWVEDKGRALGVHTRRAADPQGALDALREPLAGLAARLGLRLEPGRYVIELRPPGMDKGAALAAYVRETGASVVLFAGDDVGDLPAFEAVEALRHEGLAGLTVCSGSDEVTALVERADLVVDGPDGVVALLDALADALG
ncbi:MAG: trehalose-phosphatase [Actinomycetes bacterium]